MVIILSKWLTLFNQLVKKGENKILSFFVFYIILKINYNYRYINE